MLLGSAPSGLGISWHPQQESHECHVGGDVEGGGAAHASPGVQQHTVAYAGSQHMQSQSSPLTSWLHPASESCTAAESDVFQGEQGQKNALSSVNPVANVMKSINPLLHTKPALSHTSKD